MGTLAYDRMIVEFDDRTLAHLQVVIVQKLRRGESFLFNWTGSPSKGIGRSSVWLHPAIPLYFTFSGASAPRLNVAWIAQLTRSSNGSQGLSVSSEQSASEQHPVGTLDDSPGTDTVGPFDM